MRRSVYWVEDRKYEEKEQKRENKYHVKQCIDNLLVVLFKWSSREVWLQSVSDLFFNEHSELYNLI